MTTRFYPRPGLITVAASVLLVTVLGSIHAFSIFTPGWEVLTGASRADISLVYSLSLVALTVAVLFGHRINRVLSAPSIFVLVGVLGGAGLLFSAISDSVFLLYVCYGLIFGAANGLGYGYALQLSAQSTSTHAGVAMCLVTAFYAVGATAAPLLFSHLISIGGNRLALWVAAGLILICSLISAALVSWSGSTFRSEEPSKQETLSPLLRRARWLLWIGYGASVASGLMIIGHAFNVAIWLGFDHDKATIATVTVALGNMAGGFSAVFFSSRISARRLLTFLPFVTSIGVGLLMANPGVSFGLIGLGTVGYCYGAVIAIFPVAVARLFGTLSAPRIYGQIFTAWGFAGLLGPWLSGQLFDLTQSYFSALVFAVFCNLIAILAIHSCLPGHAEYSRVSQD